MRVAAGDMDNQRSGAASSQARGTGRKAGICLAVSRKGAVKLKRAGGDGTNDILFYRPWAVSKVSEEGGKSGQALLLYL